MYLHEVRVIETILKEFTIRYCPTCDEYLQKCDRCGKPIKTGDPLYCCLHSDYHHLCSNCYEWIKPQIEEAKEEQRKYLEETKKHGY